MPILLIKISTKGGKGVKKVQNLVYVEYGCCLIKCCMHEYICVLCSITFLYYHWTHNHRVLSALFLEKFLLWTFLKKSWHFHTFQCKLCQTTEIGCALTQNRYAPAAGRKITLNCMYLLNVSVVAAGIHCIQFCSRKCLDMAFFYLQH